MPNHRKYENQLPINEVDGRLRYIANCGHIVSHPDTDKCAECFRPVRKIRLGYVFIVDENGRTIQERRYIAEKVLGRPLKKGEVVHHIDMDKTNNSHDNLLICTREYHHLLHYRMQLAWAEGLKNAKHEQEATEVHGNATGQETSG